MGQRCRTVASIKVREVVPVVALGALFLWCCDARAFRAGLVDIALPLGRAGHLEVRALVRAPVHYMPTVFQKNFVSLKVTFQHLPALHGRTHVGSETTSWRGNVVGKAAILHHIDGVHAVDAEALALVAQRPVFDRVSRHAFAKLAVALGTLAALGGIALDVVAPITPYARPTLAGVVGGGGIPVVARGAVGLVLDAALATKAPARKLALSVHFGARGAVAEVRAWNPNYK